ncbi:hypothetical protein K440DRAFT_425735 [Wilcoxina mikolae CBS 423.85]|nr:hypothetical protein K440DRAFT_425735 [Wilcoxina mikolae CBS 423.85]
MATSERPGHASGGARRARNMANATTGDPPTTTENASDFIRKMRGMFSKVDPLLPEFEALEKARVECGDLRTQLAQKEQDMEAKEKELRKEIEYYKILGDTRIGERIESIKNSKSNEDSLAAELKQKETEIEELRRKQLDELSKLKRDLDEAHSLQRSQDKSEIEGLRREKEEALEKAEEYRKQKEEVEEKLKLGEARLEVAKSDLKQAKEKVASFGLEKLDQTFVEQATELQSMSHAICHEYFYRYPFQPSEDYNENLKRELINSGFISDEEASGEFPLLLSDTTPSRCMLMARAENIIATHVTTNIFRTTWLPLDSPFHEFIEKISNQLALESLDKEACWRSLTSDATHAPNFGWEAEVLPSMRNELRSIFNPLFEDNLTMLDELLDRLDRFFRLCIGLWIRALHSERKVIAILSTDPTTAEYHNEEHDIEVSETDNRQNRSRKKRGLPLSPGFGIRVDGTQYVRILVKGKSLPPSAPSAVRSRAEHLEIEETLERRASDAYDQPVQFPQPWLSATDAPLSPTQTAAPQWQATAGTNTLPTSTRAPQTRSTRQMSQSGARGSGGVGLGLFGSNNGSGGGRGH